METITIDSHSTTSLYNGLFTHTLQNAIFIGTILFVGLVLNTIGSKTLLNNVNNLENSTFSIFNKEEQPKHILDIDTRNRERLVFVFSLIIGGIILSGASDFLTVFLGLELQSYSAYILAASYKNYEPSEAAGLKYFLLGALSSALIFMGLALLYVYSGNTMIDLSYLVLSTNSLEYLQSTGLNVDTLIPYFGSILILLGFFWKIAAAPLQAWSIDVYDAVPTRTTAILSLLPKIGLISFIVQVIFDISSLVNFSIIGFNLDTISQGLNLNFIIYLIIALSLIIGSVYGIFQPRIKRLLAYSSVLNIGFILMGALLINFGSLDYFNPLFYLIQYVITTATIWLALTSIEKVSNIELTLTSQLQGIGNESLFGKFNSISPDFQKEEKNSRTDLKYNFKVTFIAVSLTLLILSTAGIPPMVGFFAKYEIILLSLKTEYYTLAIIAILASLISTYYYLNVIKNIWFKTAISNQRELSTLSEKSISTYLPLISLQTNDLRFNKVYTSEFVGSNSFIILLTLGISLFALQYSVIYIFLTLSL